VPLPWSYLADEVGQTPDACKRPGRSRLAAVRLEFPLTSSRQNHLTLRSS
jgi:hypothetical protein